MGSAEIRLPYLLRRFIALDHSYNCHNPADDKGVGRF
jgi:hypothetical protein